MIKLILLMFLVPSLADEDLESVIRKLQGLMTEASTPATATTSQQPPIDADAVIPCEKNGRLGECTPYYLCDEDKYINTDFDVNAVNIPVTLRFSSTECHHYSLKCCFLKKNEASPPPKVREGCGWRNPTGVGFTLTGAPDNEANYGEFPWMVAVQMKPVNIETNGLSNYTYLGGGSLIHPSVVLTMAHSIYLARIGSLKVRAGEWDLTTIREQYPYQDIDVAEVVVHPNFTKKTVHNDVALLFLASPVTTAPHVGVACLAPPNARARAGDHCFASGWGKEKWGAEGPALPPTILKRVEMPVVEHEECQAKFRRSQLGRHFILDDSFMCAGGAEQDACKGDGGSPLVCPTAYTDRYVQ